MAQLVMVEGLPGSGKSTACRFIDRWLLDRGAPVRYFPEGRTDHPADFEDVAVLAPDELEALQRDFPDEARSLRRAAERRGDLWLVRDRERAGWSGPLRDRLRDRDSYDGAITHDIHTRVLLDSWQRFADDSVGEAAVYLFECAFIQNPMSALVARFNRPESAVEEHIHRLAELTSHLDPLLVYLDAGDPERVLEAAARDRPAWWLDFVVRYHTEQGYGLARGLRGVEGLVEFMRHRRELELRLLSRLPVRTFLADVSAGDWATNYANLAEVLQDHLQVPGLVPPGRPGRASPATYCPDGDAHQQPDPRGGAR